MSRNDSPFDMQIKLLMIGDSGVGKTCLLLRYANDSFSQTFITTIGIDFKIKNIDLDSKRIKLQIWDTAGQERFRTITTSYFRGAQGILLVYDVTDKKSFNSIRNWVAQIQQHADVAVNKILIGNKCDMDEDREVRGRRWRNMKYGVSVRSRQHPCERPWRCSPLLSFFVALALEDQLTCRSGVVLVAEDVFMCYTLVHLGTCHVTCVEMVVGDVRRLVFLGVTTVPLRPPFHTATPCLSEVRRGLCCGRPLNRNEDETEARGRKA
ncbi:unnamed protein product [Scytosiphon promiscuus]